MLRSCQTRWLILKRKEGACEEARGERRLANPGRQAVRIFSKIASLASLHAGISSNTGRLFHVRLLQALWRLPFVALYGKIWGHGYANIEFELLWMPHTSAITEAMTVVQDYMLLSPLKRRLRSEGGYAAKSLIRCIHSSRDNSSFFPSARRNGKERREEMSSDAKKGIQTAAGECDSLLPWGRKSPSRSCFG